MAPSSEPRSISEPGRSRASSRLRKVALIGAGLVVVLLVAAWLAAGWFVQNRLAALVSKNPDRLLLSADELESDMFGNATVKNLRLRGQNSRCQWEVRVDEATCHVSPLGVALRRTMHFDAIRAKGVDVSVRFFPRSAEEKGTPHAAPIEGFPDPPLTFEQRPAKRVKKKGPWTYRFTDAVAEDVRSIWLGPYRFQGPIVAGCDDIVVQARQRLEIDGARFDANGGKLSKGDVVMLESLVLESLTTIDGYDMANDPPRDIVRHLSTRAKGSVSIRDLGLDDASIAGLDWITFGDSPATLDMDVAIDDGRLASGTRLNMNLQSLALGALRRVIEGGAVMSLTVDEMKGDPVGKLVAEFGEFTVRRNDAPKGLSPLKASGLRVEVTAPEPSLADRVENWTVAATLPDARLADVRVLDGLIPEGLPLQVRGGSASMSGRLDATPAGASGQVHLVGRGLALTYQGQPLAGDVDLDGQLKSADFGGGRYDFSGSKLVLDGDRPAGKKKEQEAGWKGSVSLPRATLDLDGPVRFSGDVDIAMQDLRPVWQMGDAALGLPSILAPLVKAKDVSLTARLDFGPGRVRVQDLALDGKGLKALACVNVAGAEKSYVVWADSGLAQGGARLSRGEKSVKPFAGRAWYAEHAGDCGTKGD